ncbi:MAG: hypothetical protein KBB11_11870 [Bacteroidales bacterium]|nr:hypothetical protein [Bacteroidales bacterium]
MNRITYFYNDSFLFLAAINDGTSGFFVLFTNEPDPKWKFIIPGSERWDAYHQNIYYTHHDYEPCPDEISRNLPPLPEVPEHTHMKWGDNFPVQKLHCSDYPFISAQISETGLNTLQYWIVLYEDLYESKFGDGTFLYFKGAVYEQEQEATTFAKTMNAKGSWPDEEAYTCKLLKIMKKDDELEVIEGRPKPLEHYKIEKVLARVDHILNPDSAAQFGDWEEYGRYN